MVLAAQFSCEYVATLGLTQAVIAVVSDTNKQIYS